MIDLHTHTFFSDGALLPSELAQRAKEKGYRAIAFTDHADMSNIEFIVSHIKQATAALEEQLGIYVFCGVELTHIPPPAIPDAITFSLDIGAEIVVVHGETVTEPVAKHTNLSAIKGRCDILAHPGLISTREAELAAEMGVMLEITTRQGHSLTNGHVAKKSRETGAMCILNTDTHSPGDLITAEFRRIVLTGAGMSDEEISQTIANAERLVEKILRRRKK